MITSTGPAESEAPASADRSRIRPEADHATIVAGWVRSTEEGGFWCSRAEHPFPAAAITDWWQDGATQPWLLLDHGAPVAYGEIWVDDEEDEVELARLIVDPARRRAGVGSRLVAELVALAKASGRSACFIRVAPGNDGALALYRAAGFQDVDDATAAEWNQGQPTAYRWLEHPDFPAATRG
jgi:ribosomal protein S18 acetylase RimI-like enzyme